MKDGKADRLLNIVGSRIDRIGGDDDEIGSAPLQPLGGIDYGFIESSPVSLLGKPLLL